jgi:drug/metabolite transporter (DMT)-like permease
VNGTKILAIVLLVGGILGLAYGGFTYTKSTSTTDLGPISLEVKDRERVNVPLWAGIALVVGGGALLVAPARKN